MKVDWNRARILFSVAVSIGHQYGRELSTHSGIPIDGLVDCVDRLPIFHTVVGGLHVEIVNISADTCLLVDTTLASERSINEASHREDHSS